MTKAELIAEIERLRHQRNVYRATLVEHKILKPWEKLEAFLDRTNPSLNQDARLNRDNGEAEWRRVIRKC